MFLTPRNKRQTHHVYHAIHHNFTTQKPPLRATFCKTTLKKHQQKQRFSTRRHAGIFSCKLSRIFRIIPHSEHMEILQTGLQHIDQPVVSIGIRRPQKKARLQHKILGIADNPFNHLAVIEVHPHPQTRDDRCMFMKMKSSMAKISVKSFDEEDSLGILGGNIFHGPGIQQLQSNGIKWIDGIVLQQLLNRPQLLRFSQPPHSMAFIPDDNTITIRRLFVAALLRSYDAWFRGDRSYCLILYRSAL